MPLDAVLKPNACSKTSTTLPVLYPLDYKQLQKTIKTT